MYSFIKNLGWKRFLIKEMPSLSLSLIISETAFKFGSFILECGAFLATWYMISMVLDNFNALKKR